MRTRFGEWTFDSETRQLRRGGADVHISTKAFDLLKLLLEARPRVVSKAQVQDALWPGIFVSEANLFTVVSELRSALEDDARRPRFVRTVHGVGYAFCGEAIDIASTAATASARPVCVLVWENRQFPLPVGEHVIGRDPDISASLDSSTVSRRHARLIVTADAATIEDLASKNGTFVNDVPAMRTTPLRDGDRIRVGSVLLTFRRTEPALSTETVKGEGRASGESPGGG